LKLLIRSDPCPGYGVNAFTENGDPIDEVIGLTFEVDVNSDIIAPGFALAVLRWRIPLEDMLQGPPPCRPASPTIDL